MKLNNIYNEDCCATMQRMASENVRAGVILTSPPYNTGRHSNSERSRANHEGRYDIHIDNMSPEQYCRWCVELFKSFDAILDKDGVVLWNVSYGNDQTGNAASLGLMWLTIADIIRGTNFTVADRIIWKKKSALPNNVSPNKLTRIVEDVFVFCRKDELKTFKCNKNISSRSDKTGQAFYTPIYNFVEAANNDGSCKLNKATYSSELCTKLLDIYAPKGCTVYDPFMGTGTTAVACVPMGLQYLGSELSEAQTQYAQQRVADAIDELLAV